MKPPITPLRPIPRLIFFFCWLQLPLYMGLIIIQVVYVYLFVVEVWRLASRLSDMDEIKTMLAMLGLIDVVMISSLPIMVIVSGYDISVSKFDIEGHENEPGRLDHVNTGVLKMKLSMTLVSISSTHLLKTFIDAARKGMHTTSWRVAIHVVFLASVLVIVWVGRIVSCTYPYGEAADAH